VLVAASRLIQFWWRNLNKANSLEVILNGSSLAASTGAGSGGSWVSFLKSMSLSTSSATAPKPEHGRARRGSVLGLMSSLLEGGNMSRVLALQNRQVCARPMLTPCFPSKGGQSEQSSGSSPLGQALLPASCALLSLDNTRQVFMQQANRWMLLQGRLIDGKKAVHILAQQSKRAESR
jgi:hypothetical protein